MPLFLTRCYCFYCSFVQLFENFRGHSNVLREDESCLGGASPALPQQKTREKVKSSQGKQNG